MIRLLSILFLLLPGFLYGQEQMWNQIERGRENLFNLEFQKAEKIFKQISMDYSDKPYGDHYLSQTYLWIYLGNKDSLSLSHFEKFSKSSVVKAEKMLEKDKNNHELTLLLGWAYMFRAMSETAQGSSIDAFWASKASFSFFEKTLSLKPTTYDAYLGIGLFNYALSFIPDIFHWVLNLTGLSADKEEGVNNIRLAYKKGKNKTEAGFHLAKVYTDYLLEYDSASVLLGKLIESYPRNSLFHYQNAIVQIQKNKLQNAEKSLKKVLSLNIPEFKQTNEFSKFLLGDIYFFRNDFAAARAHYENFLMNTGELDYLGIGNFRLGICYAMEGDTTLFKRQMILAANGNEDIADDVYASEKGSYLFERGISLERKKVLMMKNNLANGKYKTVIDSLAGFVETLEESELKGETYNLLAEASFKLDKFEACTEYAQNTLKSNFKYEKWLIPRSYILLANVAIAKKDSELAGRYLKSASKTDDILYKDVIDAQIHQSKRKLNKLKS